MVKKRERKGYALILNSENRCVCSEVCHEKSPYRKKRKYLIFYGITRSGRKLY